VRKRIGFGEGRPRGVRKGSFDSGIWLVKDGDIHLGKRGVGKEERSIQQLSEGKEVSEKRHWQS